MIHRRGITPSIFNSQEKRFNCGMPNPVEEIDLDKKLFPVYVMIEGDGEERMCNIYTVSGYLWGEKTNQIHNQTDFLSIL